LDINNLHPPNTLQEIFQTSNANRKMNKQRKRGKAETLDEPEPSKYQSSFGGKGYGPTSPAPSPPQNAYQLVQLMYKLDA
jgi:hypothetical protein